MNNLIQKEIEHLDKATAEFEIGVAIIKKQIQEYKRKSQPSNLYQKINPEKKKKKPTQKQKQATPVSLINTRSHDHTKFDEDSISDIEPAEQALLKEKTLLLAYSIEKISLKAQDTSSQRNIKIKRTLETIFEKDYPLKLQEIIAFIKKLGGHIKTNGSGSSHYRFHLESHVGDFCHKHKPGHSERRISSISKRIIYNTFKRSGVFEKYDAQVSYDKHEPASIRRLRKLSCKSVI